MRKFAKLVLVVRALAGPNVGFPPSNRFSGLLAAVGAKIATHVGALTTALSIPLRILAGASQFQNISKTGNCH